MTSPRKARTFLRATAAIALSSALAACAGWVPGRQSYWDSKVKEMCKKDGGMTIYEHVKLTHRQYRELGGAMGIVSVPLRRTAKPGSPYVADTRYTTIHEANPKVYRRETSIVRTSDSKVLARQIQYMRIGGDFPSPAHESSYSCADVGIPLDVENQTFEIVRGSK